MKPLLALAALILAGPALGRAQSSEVKPAPAPAARPGTRASVDALSQSDLGRVLPLLKDNYLGAEKLSDLEVQRATVQGLLERLGPGATILEAPTPATAAEASPFRSEILDANVGYLRLGSLTPANLAELDTALANFAAKSVGAVVLDLRATPAGSEFEAAATVCKRFCPKGKVLFTLKKPNTREERLLTSKEDPRYQGLLTVLIDRETSGAPEVIAAVLRTHTKALLLGQKTRGQAAEFADVPLPSGKLLHVAVGEIALPENVSVFPGGVRPDLAVEVPRETTEAVLKAGLEKSMKELVAETERPRMNEAALVAGNNPEIEAYQAAQRAKADKTKPLPRDLVLQRALDFITTINVYEKKGAEK